MIRHPCKEDPERIRNLENCPDVIILVVQTPKGPCTQIVYTLGPMYPYREYFKANVYTIWVHGPFRGPTSFGVLSVPARWAWILFVGRASGLGFKLQGSGFWVFLLYGDSAAGFEGPGLCRVQGFRVSLGCLGPREV